MDFDTKHLMRDTMRALGFLSRLPVPSHFFEGDDGSLSNTSRAFPIAAVLISLPAIAVLILATLVSLPPLLTALLVVGTQIITTGALHEDGIADVADGFFGANNKERRLEIMKDSSIGTYGALALIISFAIRVVAIAAIAQASTLSAGLAIIAANALAKGALVWHWSNLANARPGGTADKTGAPTAQAYQFALMSAATIGIFCTYFSRGFISAALAFALTALVTSQFHRLASSKIGGHTGDTLGACAVLAEIACLTGLASAI